MVEDDLRGIDGCWEHSLPMLIFMPSCPGIRAGYWLFYATSMKTAFGGLDSKSEMFEILGHRGLSQNGTSLTKEDVIDVPRSGRDTMKGPMQTVDR